MEFFKKLKAVKQITASDIISASSAIFTSAANYLLSNEKLWTHAIVTCGGSACNSLGLIINMYNTCKTYKDFHESINNKTLFFKDTVHMKAIFPSICSIINAFLMASYYLTGFYEGEDKNPNETSSAHIHNVLAVLAIVIPYIISKYFDYKYPLVNIPKDDYTILKESRKKLNQWSLDSKNLNNIINSLNKVYLDKEINNELIALFEEINFNAKIKFRKRSNNDQEIVFIRKSI